MTKLDHMTPMLNVRNIERSLDFYQQKLGFSRANSDEQLRDWRWARIVSGDIDLMLMETDRPSAARHGANPEEDGGWPVQICFLLEEVEELHDRLRKDGLDVTALSQSKYGLLEFAMKDPDGHILRFSKDLLDEDDNLIE